jgi:chromosome segregation ATPase
VANLKNKIERQAQDHAGELATLKTKVEQQEKAYAEETAKLEASLQSTIQAKAAADDKVENYIRQLSQLHEEIATARQRAALLAKEKVVAEENFKVHIEKLAEMENGLAALKNAIEESEQKAALLINEKAQAQEQIASYEQRIDELEDKLQAQMQIRQEALAEVNAVSNTAIHNQETAFPDISENAIADAYTEEIKSLDTGLGENAVIALLNDDKSNIATDAARQPFEMAEIEPELTGVCDCCDKAGIPEADLFTIDSGQQLCPECLGLFR